MWYIQTAVYPDVHITQSNIKDIIQPALDSDKEFKNEYYEAQKKGQFLLLQHNGEMKIIQFNDYPDVEWYIYHPKPNDPFNIPNKGEKQIKSIVHLLAKHKHNAWYHSSHNSTLTIDEKYFQAERDVYQADYYINIYNTKLSKEKDKKKKEEINAILRQWKEKRQNAEAKKGRVFESLTNYTRKFEADQEPIKVFRDGKFQNDGLKRRQEALTSAYQSHRPIPKRWHAIKQSNKENRSPNTERMNTYEAPFSMNRNASNFYF